MLGPGCWVGASSRTATRPAVARSSWNACAMLLGLRFPWWLRL